MPARANKDGATEGKDDTTREREGSERGTSAGSLARRSFLKLGAVAAGVTVGAGTAAAASGDTRNVVEAGADPNGDERIDDVLADLAGSNATVTFPPGTYKLGSFASSANNLTLRGDDATIVPASDGGTVLALDGAGWAVDGFEFDYRHLSEAPTVRLGGGDWTFQNVAIRGRVPTAERRNYRLLASVSGGTTGRIRRVYLPDGACSPGESDNTTALWCGPGVRGTLHVDGVWVEGFSNNTFYMSNAPGRVVVENSFFRNSNNGNCRVGGNSVLRNNTFVKDGPIPVQRWSGASVMRGIWVNGNKPHGDGGEVLVEDCDFVWTNAEGAGLPINASEPSSQTTVRDSRFHVETGSVAASVGDGTALTMENVQVSGTSNPIANSSGDVRSWGVETVGEQRADPSPPLPAPPEIGTAPGDSEIGGGSGDDSKKRLPNTLTVSGTGTETRYEFTVSEALTPEAGSLEDWDGVDGTTATGWVTTDQHADRFRFAGDVTDFTVHRGQAAVAVNGEPVDPATLGRNPDAHTLTIRGAGTPTRYEFSASGDLSENADGPGLETWDAIQGSTATGWVTTDQHVDSFTFTGEITDFTVHEGDATVRLDGQEVDPASFGPDQHTLTIRGTGARTNYAFSVSGDLSENPDGPGLETWDAIQGSAAAGWVTTDQHVDSFTFTGEITEFSFREGEATVLVDGQAVDPTTL